MSDDYEGDVADAAELRKVFWQGRQWCVTDFGIETKERDRYYIEAERLGDLTEGPDSDTRPTAERMLHTGTKTWVDIEDFAAAFAVSLQIHTGRFTELPQGAFHNALADLRWGRKSDAVYRELASAERGPLDVQVGFGPVMETSDEMDRRYPNERHFYEVQDDADTRDD